MTSHARGRWSAVPVECRCCTALRAIRDHGLSPVATTKGFTDYKARLPVKRDARIDKAVQIRVGITAANSAIKAWRG